MMTTILVIVGWVACGILAAGFLFPDFQVEYSCSQREALGLSLLLGLIWGPVMLLIAFFATGFGRHGWRLR